MTIEGLGKKFQEARLARNLTLDEAARMTKIRPQRLAEIEADDFSQFPSLAYAKGFLLIYGKFLDVDVTPYLDAFEDSESVTVDGYSYLQENERAKPVSAPVVRRRPAATRGPGQQSRFANAAHCGRGGFSGRLSWDEISSQCAAARAWARKLDRANVANCDAGSCLRRVEPGSSAKHCGCRYECAGRVACPDTGPPETRKALAANSTAPAEPEVRKAKPVTKEELAQAREGTDFACTGIRRTKSSRDPAAQTNLRKGNARRRRKSRVRTMGLPG